MLSLRYYVPPPIFRPYLGAYYIIDGVVSHDYSLRDTLLPENANLRIDCSSSWRISGLTSEPFYSSDAMIFGPTSQPIDVEHQGPFHVIGIGIRTRGWHSFFGLDANEVADRVLDASLLLGDAGSAFIETVGNANDDSCIIQAINRLFLTLLHQHTEPCPSLLDHFEHYLMNAAGENLTVDAMSKALDISNRQLERWSNRLYGFPPKLLLRRRRFLRAASTLRAHPELGWMDVVGNDYYDQSHFIREFKQFSHLSPKAFTARPPLLIGSGYALRDKLSAMRRQSMALSDISLQKIIGTGPPTAARESIISPPSITSS